MLEDLTEGGSLPPTNDGYPLWIRVREHARMDEGLVVGGVAVERRLLYPVKKDNAIGLIKVGMVCLVRPILGERLYIREVVAEAGVDDLINIDALIIALNRDELEGGGGEVWYWDEEGEGRMTKRSQDRTDNKAPQRPNRILKQTRK